MVVTNLRKVGGSVMLAVPPAILDLLDLRAGAPVTLAVEDGRLVVASRRRVRYDLSDLLAQCEPKSETSAEDRDWTSAGPAGGELL